jgi:hypothetical protein
MTRRLRRDDEQALVDKVAGKLPSWKGRLLNKAGRLPLVNSVLLSLVLYHMTMFQLSKWAIKKIDRIRPRFLWFGSDDARSGHYLVNWSQVQRPRNIGGLDILDLERFSMALHLR